jgi:hypothetical protein
VRGAAGEVSLGIGVLALAELMGRVYAGTDPWPAWVDVTSPDSLIPMVSSPDRFIVVVAGGDGRHSAWMPAWNICQGATQVVEEVRL